MSRSATRSTALLIAMVAAIVLIVGVIHLDLLNQENVVFEHYLELNETHEDKVEIAEILYLDHYGIDVHADAETDTNTDTDRGDRVDLDALLAGSDDVPLLKRYPIPPIVHARATFYVWLSLLVFLLLALAAVLAYLRYPVSIQLSGLFTLGFALVLAVDGIFFLATHPVEQHWHGALTEAVAGVILLIPAVGLLGRYQKVMSATLVRALARSDERLRGMPGLTATRDGALATASAAAASGAARGLEALRDAVQSLSSKSADAAIGDLTSDAYRPITRTPDTMIATELLCKHYGPTRALHDVSFTVDRGEIVGFLGPNGAGKSTCMKILTTFIPPTSGNAWIGGDSVLDRPLAVRQAIGYLPESNPLYRDITVTGYLNWVASVRNLKGDRRTRSRDWVIAVCGLKPVLKMTIGELSKGFRQRVGLAQALLHEPDILILDEPSSGLDPNQIIEVRDLIKSVGHEKTVILSTHILQEVTAMCSRVIVIDKGRLVANGSVPALASAMAASRKLVVRLAGASKKSVEDALQSLAGVTGCVVAEEQEALAGAGSGASAHDRLRVEIYPAPDEHLDALTGRCLELCVKKHLRVHEIRHETASLEDVFVTLTAGSRY